jgi:hypothetical protein
MHRASAAQRTKAKTFLICLLIVWYLLKVFLLSRRKPKQAAQQSKSQALRCIDFHALYARFNVLQV